MEKQIVACFHGFLGRASDWLRLPWSDDQTGELQIEPRNLWDEFESLKPRSLQEWGERMPLPEKVWGVGYSMGGRLLLHAYLAQPERFHGLIIVSAHPGLVSKEERALRIEADSKWQKRFLSEEWGALMHAWNSQAVLQTSDSWPLAESEFKRETLARVMEVVSLGRQEALEYRLPHVLWLAGQRDEKFATLYRKMQNSGAQVEIWKNAGHRLPWDEPAQFTQRVREFVLGKSSHSDK